MEKRGIEKELKEMSRFSITNDTKNVDHATGKDTIPFAEKCRLANKKMSSPPKNKMMTEYL
jgi:hypothetical protein